MILYDEALPNTNQTITSRNPCLDNAGIAG